MRKGFVKSSTPVSNRSAENRISASKTSLKKFKAAFQSGIERNAIRGMPEAGENP
jgi:hypothetical protein